MLQGARRRGGGCHNWYDIGGWKETIHMPSGVNRFQIVTIYPGHFILVPSAVTEIKVQHKKLIRVGYIREVYLAIHNRSNSASYNGIRGVFQILLRLTHEKVFRHLRHPWAVALSLIQVQTL